MTIRATGTHLAAAIVLASACAACGQAAGSAVAPANPDVAAAIERARENDPAAFERRVVVLGFDGCDPDLVEEMIRKGKLPNFARMRREGAWGALESISPTLSPVVWTTIATGMPPERHGILDFVTDTPRGIVPVSSKMRQADTMWEVLSRHGEDVGVVGWLVTYPAEPVRGFLVTDRMGLLAFEFGKEQDTDAPQRTYPEELAAEIERRDRVTVDDLPLRKVRPFADVDEEEYARFYATRFHPLNRLGNLRLTMATAETFRTAGQRLWAERRPRFFACYFEAMDALSHVFMRHAPPKLPDVPEDEFLKYRTAIEANYVWHDRVLGEYLDLADAKTTVLVISDHGFKSGEFRRADSSDFHAKTGAMWHRPYGVLYAWGNGIARGRRVDGASVFDVAPTVLAAMGYPRPDDMRGRVLTDLFADGLAFERVPTYYGTTLREKRAAEEASAGTAPATPEEEAAMERMAALGYISGDRSDPATTKLNLGVRFMTAGRIEEALEQFQGILAKERTPRALTSVIDALIRLRRLDEALPLLEEAEALDPTDVPTRVLRGRYHLLRGELDLAERSLRQAVHDGADLPFTHDTLGTVLEARADEAEKKGDAKAARTFREAAAECYRTSLKLEPRQPVLAASLAQILLSLSLAPEPTREALELLDGALRARPDHPLHLNNRSIAQMRLGLEARKAGRSDEAQRLLEDALASATRAVDVWRERRGKEYAKGWANRSYALWQLDRLDEAAQSARKVLEVQPDYVLNAHFLAALREARKL